MGYYTAFKFSYVLPKEKSNLSKKVGVEDFKTMLNELGVEIPDTITFQEKSKKPLETELVEFLETLETNPMLVENYGTIKWYEHEKDILAISRRFPKILFILEGEGEDSGDIWKKYFKNGKIQVCKAKITFDEFDESKLR